MRRAFGVKVLAGAGALLALLLGAVAWSMPDGRLHVYLLDVPGAATLIQTPTGRTILVDAGESGRALSTGLGDALPFWDRTLDAVILTRPVPEKVGGLAPVMTRYEINTALTNGQRGANPAADTLWAALEERHIVPQAVLSGTRIQTGDGVTVTVWHEPAQEELDEGDPGRPLVVMVEYGEARFLLARDLTSEDRAALLEDRRPVYASVLHITPSGDEEADDTALLAAVSPQVIVVPQSGPPGAEGVAELEATNAIVYQTAQDGTVHLATDGERLFVWPREPAN